MDRLTEWNNKNSFLPVLVRGKALGPAYFKEARDYKDYRDALERLAAYEDTGLSPEEVAELAAAKEAGRLVALPCKAGDIVYDKDAEPYAVFSIQLYSRWPTASPERRRQALKVNIHCVSPTTGQKKSFSIGKRSLGRTVFLTREEAEAAVRRTRGENDGQKNP